jgi:hypothetical protein
MTNASSYIVKYLSISSYIRKPFLIYDFATASIWIPYIWGKFDFLFYHCILLQIKHQPTTASTIQRSMGWWRASTGASRTHWPARGATTSWTAGPSAWVLLGMQNRAQAVYGTPLVLPSQFLIRIEYNIFFIQPSLQFKLIDTNRQDDIQIQTRCKYTVPTEPWKRVLSRIQRASDLWKCWSVGRMLYAGELIEDDIPIMAIGHVFFGSRQSLVPCTTYTYV